MPDTIPLHELGKLPEEQLQSLVPITTQQMLILFRQSVGDSLRHAGFSHLPKDLATTGTPGAKREVRLALRTDAGDDAYIIFPPAASDPIDVEALSSEECSQLEQMHPQTEIYYASFFLTPGDYRIYMVGPVLVRRNGTWRTATPGGHIVQFLPPRFRTNEADCGGASLLGGAALFKLEHMLLPHLARRGFQPTFSVEGLFSERSQDSLVLQATMDRGASPPTHLVLACTTPNQPEAQPRFFRTFFYYSDRPENILILRDDPCRQDSDISGPILLQTVSGAYLRADCLETMVLSGALLSDSRYKWTLSLVATSCKIPEVAAVNGLIQPHLGSTVTTLRAKVLDTGVQSVNGRLVGVWQLEVKVKGETLHICTFVSRELWELEFPPHRGDEVECNGRLYAAPDSFMGIVAGEKKTARSCKTPRVAKRVHRLPSGIDEASACRALGVALFTTEWDSFSSMAAENLTYTSAMNGTRIAGRDTFIHYMRDRRTLWEEQRGWAGMCMDTGTVLHDGKRRACAMISCYGHMVGAWVLSLSEGLITSIETLSPEVNATFEKDTACSAKPTFFHPMRGHVTPHPAPQSPLQHFAYIFLMECMRVHVGASKSNPAASTTAPLGSASWLKTTRNEPSCCDLVFALANRIYVVCVEEVERHPKNGGSLEDIVQKMPGKDSLLSLSEKQDLIPCIFPVQRNMEIDPADGWNLWDIRTVHPISPELSQTEVTTHQPSAWEIYLASLEHLQKRIEKMGGKVIAAHETPTLTPHIWFRDARGRLSWVLIQIDGRIPLPIPSIPAEKGEETAYGYMTTAIPYGDPAGCFPARRGEPIFIQFSDFKSIL